MIDTECIGHNNNSDSLFESNVFVTVVAAAPILLFDKNKILTNDTAKAIASSLKERDMEKWPLQDHELDMLKHLLLDNSIILKHVMSILEQPLKDRDTKEYPWRDHEKQSLGQLTIRRSV